VLVADDDPLILELVSGHVERLGFDTDKALDGQAAIAHAAESLPSGYDLIVTDLCMPKASGRDLIEFARQIHCCKRFLIMSGNIISEDWHRSAREGESEYIEKPFNFREFQSKLERLSIMPPDPARA